MLRPRDRSLPPPFLIVAAAGAAFLVIPLVAMAARTPWRGLAAETARPEVLEALRLSILTSSAATAIGLVVGVPLAWFHARVRFPGSRLLRTLTTVPVVLPPVASGVALLAAFGRRGLIGRWLEHAFGVHLAFTTGAAVLAEAFVSLPLLVITVEAGIRSVDRRLEEAARSLGAGRLRVAARVTLPLAGSSLAAGAALCWARALGEFGATITFAGNFAGRTQTMPLAVYFALESRPQAAVAMSLILVAVSALVLYALRDRWLKLR